MRYGTWNLLFTDDLTDGATVPIELQGAFYCNQEQTMVAGYIPENVNVNEFVNWSLTEITADEFLSLLLTINPDGELRNGKAWFPDPQLNNGNY